MIRSLASLTFSLFLNACSLVHDNLPNESPTLQLSRVICQTPEAVTPDTMVNGSGEICRTRRGGEVRFEVRGADEDDDPLVYRWNAFGAGSFRDSVAMAENSWFAPETIIGNSERFIVQVTIADRNCGLVPDPDDRQRCIDNSQEIVEDFFVEVVQRRPALSVITDTTILFSTPLLLIDALGTDPDNDPLEYRWELLDGREDGLHIGQDAIREDTGLQIGSRAAILPLFMGDYLLSTSIDDGEELVASEISVMVDVDPPLPDGGMVRLTLPSVDREYEIDVYEYPNVKGEVPLEATFFQAVSLCGEQGKRLCEPAEWQYACQGGEVGLTYSSTDDPTDYIDLPHFGVRFCNVPGSIFTLDIGLDLIDQLSPAGSFPNCGHSIGVYDLSGNLGEWTASPDAFNNLDVFEMRSNVAFPGTCTSRSEAGTLPITGANIYDPVILQEQIDRLDLVERQGYEQILVGFRCCR